MGYNWSIWYVPREYKDLMLRYKFQHIPHVTVRTHLPVKPTKNELCQWKLKVDCMYFTPELVPIVEVDDEDDEELQAIGWYVINPLPIHKPHLSYLYLKKDMPFPTSCIKSFPDRIFDWDLYIADTRDEDFSKWKIIEI